MPIPPEHDPKLAFERLFNSGKPKDAAQRKAISRKYDKSILDFVMEDTRRLQRQLGQTDRHKLEEYLTSVREIEHRINRSRKNEPQVPDYPKPDGIPGDYREHLKLMFDLIILAFQTDSTRIATFLQAHDGSNRSFREIGVAEGHHTLSHHQGNDNKINKIAKIDRFYVENFANFLKKMNSIKEGEGSLLDNCAIVYGGGISDANRHAHHDLPLLLAGGRNMGFQPGRHVVFPKDKEIPMTNLYLTILESFGAEAEKLGDSTGPLSGV